MIIILPILSSLSPLILLPLTHSHSIQQTLYHSKKPNQQHRQKKTVSKHAKLLIIITTTNPAEKRIESISASYHYWLLQLHQIKLSTTALPLQLLLPPQPPLLQYHHRHHHHHPNLLLCHAKYYTLWLCSAIFLFTRLFKKPPPPPPWMLLLCYYSFTSFLFWVSAIRKDSYMQVHFTSTMNQAISHVPLSHSSSLSLSWTVSFTASCCMNNMLFVYHRHHIIIVSLSWCDIVYLYFT